MERWSLASMVVLGMSMWGCAPETDGQPVSPNIDDEQPQAPIRNELPVGFVRVPGGVTHESCVHHVPHDATVSPREDGVNILVDGVVMAHYPPCHFGATLSRAWEDTDRLSVAPPHRREAVAPLPAAMQSRWLED